MTDIVPILETPRLTMRGLIGIVAAGIWGRPQPPPDLPDVFT